MLACTCPSITSRPCSWLLAYSPGLAVIAFSTASKLHSLASLTALELCQIGGCLVVIAVTLLVIRCPSVFLTSARPKRVDVSPCESPLGSSLGPSLDYTPATQFPSALWARCWVRHRRRCLLIVVTRDCFRLDLPFVGASVFAPCLVHPPSVLPAASADQAAVRTLLVSAASCTGSSRILAVVTHAPGGLGLGIGSLLAVVVTTAMSHALS